MYPRREDLKIVLGLLTSLLSPAYLQYCQEKTMSKTQVSCAHCASTCACGCVHPVGAVLVSTVRLRAGASTVRAPSASALHLRARTQLRNCSLRRSSEIIAFRFS